MTWMDDGEKKSINRKPSRPNQEDFLPAFINNKLILNFAVSPNQWTVN